VIFTAHSVPTRTVQGDAPDPYDREAKQTAAMVAAKLPELTEWHFAFQSQGMSGGPWLGPTVEETLKTLKEQGTTGVVIQPIGFVCDHVEVLYDIDIAFQQTARDIGLKLWRTESLNDSPLLIEALDHVINSDPALSREFSK
jgi:ferrochelatase